MPRLFKTHPLTVMTAVKSNQAVLDTGERAYDKLRRAAFIPIDKTADEYSFGAVTLEDYRSTDFGPGEVEFGEYIVFSVRTDERKIPGAALQKELDDALDTEMARIKEQGKNFISRARKKELKEQVKLRLLSRMPPVPKVVDVWWNTKTNLVFVTDKSPKVVDYAAQAFDDAFGPEYSLADVSLGNYAELLDMGESDLGTQFLTWLWNERTEGGTYDTTLTPLPYAAYISDKVTISNRRENVTATVLDGEGFFDEIAAGVADGKEVVSAGVNIETSEISFRMVLDAGRLPSINSLTIPTVTHHEEQEFAGALMEQISKLEDAYALVLDLFGHFVKAHLPGQKEAQKLRETLMESDVEKVEANFGGKTVTIYSKNAA